MSEEKRQFCASVSVRHGEQRAKLELSPAEKHGGPEGFYRVRVSRRWLDMDNGEMRFVNRESLAVVVAEFALYGLQKPAPAPGIPCGSRVSVRREDGLFEGTWTNTEPILDYAGRWMVNVSLEGQRVFVPVENIIVHKERRRG